MTHIVANWPHWDALDPSIHEVERTTNAVVYTTQGKRISKDRVLASFENHEDAVSLLNAIHGVRGERDRRCKAAWESADKALKVVLGSLEK